ncbi:MAG: OmpH family outer membrane protein [Holophagaceae bacterium]
MKFKTLLFASLVSLITVAQDVPSDATPRLAMFIPQQVLQSTTRGKKLLSEFQVVEKNWSDKIEAKQKEGQDLQKQLTSASIDDAAKEKINRQLRDIEFDFKKMQEDAQAEVGKAQQKIQVQFNNEITPIVEAIAKERKLQMILNYQQGLYTIFDTAWGLDFTNEVSKRYDAASSDKPAAAKASAPASAPAKKK